MLDKFEFSDTKQVRKTLLISSFVGLAFENLSNYSTGNIEFLGFKIPVDKAEFIPELIGYLIIYMLIALIVRYSDEDLKKRYERFETYAKLDKESDESLHRLAEIRRKFRASEIHQNAVKLGVILLDLVIPILVALYILWIIYLK